ncbi:hypothetical protein GGS20DRAFT_344957 [Poronia punctata]|nr:hypothetical protein GGS20DRAFT_344957 [Poronia punctata]
MAEAIAALGLACSIMQVISFAGEVIKLTRTIKKGGTPDPDLAKKVAHLKIVADSFEGDVARFDPVTPDAGRNIMNNEERQRQQVARQRLRTLATELVSYIKEHQVIYVKLETLASTSKRDRITGILQYKLKYAKRIEGLEKAIGKTRRQMDSEFLSRICSSVQASHLCSTAEFTSLNNDLQAFISQWAQGKREMQHLVSTEAQATRAVFTTEAQVIRNHIDSRLSEINSGSLKGRLLSTLRFPEMNQRENTIGDADKDTTEWIFSDYSRGEGERSFGEWLSSDDALFWITGKAGSGKSTLIKSVLRDRRTKEHLATWRPSVVILHFFFFELGVNPLQTQLRGCLRTLLHQLISRDTNALYRLLSTNTALAEKLSEHDWALSELQEALYSCLRLDDTSFCIFLDGLDEQHTDESNSMLTVVDALANLPNVKLCISSRPENVFRRHFNLSPTIYSHKLTSDAMLFFVKDRMNKHIRRYASSTLGTMGENEKNLDFFARHLVEKSEGVFLWTALVLRGILQGIQDGDTWDMLARRAKQYNMGLGDLYKSMLNRHNGNVQHYRDEASRILSAVCKDSMERQRSLTFYNNTLTAFDTIFLGDEVCRKRWSEIVRERDVLADSDVDYLLTAHAQWLHTRTAGLVELHPGLGLFSRIGFVHRSAEEFLKGTTEGRKFLNMCETTPKEDSICYIMETIRWTIFTLTVAERTQKLNLVCVEMARLMHRSGLEEEMPKFYEHFKTQYSQWLPMFGGDINRRHVLAKCLASSGLLVLLKYARVEIFDPLSPAQKAEVLFDCIAGLARIIRPSKEDHQLMERLRMSADTHEPGIAIIKRFFACIRWLLKFDAAPGIEAGQPGVTVYHAGSLDKLPHISQPNPYEYFMYVVGGDFLPLYVKRHFTGTDLQDLIGEIDACFIMFHERVIKVAKCLTVAPLICRPAVVVSVPYSWFLENFKRAKNIGDNGTFEFERPSAIELHAFSYDPDTSPVSTGRLPIVTPYEAPPDLAEAILRMMGIWLKHRLLHGCHDCQDEMLAYRALFLNPCIDAGLPVDREQLTSGEGLASVKNEVDRVMHKLASCIVKEKKKPR